MTEKCTPGSAGYRYARKVVAIPRGDFVETDAADMREIAMDRLRTEMHLQGRRVTDIDVSFHDRDPERWHAHNGEYVYAIVEAIVI